MAIVKYTNPKSGVTYAYESTGRWNPETRRNEPIRTYLGRVDSETGNIIPTGGKRGRKRQTDTGKQVVPTAEDYENSVNALSETQAMLNKQLARIQQLEAENKALKAVLSEIAARTLPFAG